MREFIRKTGWKISSLKLFEEGSGINDFIADRKFGETDYCNWIMSWSCSYVYVLSCIHWHGNFSTQCKGFLVYKVTITISFITNKSFLYH